jgi:hypothetical protein
LQADQEELQIKLMAMAVSAQCQLAPSQAGLCPLKCILNCVYGIGYTFVVWLHASDSLSKKAEGTLCLNVDDDFSKISSSTKNVHVVPRSLKFSRNVERKAVFVVSWVQASLEIGLGGATGSVFGAIAGSTWFRASQLEMMQSDITRLC